MEVLEPEFYIILKSLASTKTSIGSHHRLTKASIADIFQFLKTIPLFEESLNENEEMFFRFVTKLKVKELLPGEELFDEEIKSKYFYILLRGKVQIRDNNLPPHKYEDSIFGDVFGLNEIEKNEDFQGSVICLKESFFLKVEYNLYRKFRRDIIADRFNKFSSLMKKFPIFSKLPITMIERAFSLFEKRMYNKGDFVYRENSKIDMEKDGLYLIVKGKFSLSKKPIQITEKNALENIDNELNFLKKQGEALWTCLNGKFGTHSSNFKTIQKKIEASFPRLNDNSKKVYYDNPFGEHYDNTIMITKKNTYGLPIVEIEEGTYFGDIEIYSSDEYYTYSVKCEKDHSITYFFPYNKIKLFLNGNISEKFEKNSLKTARLLQSVYVSASKINHQKVDTRNFYTIPKDPIMKNINRNKIININSEKKQNSFRPRLIKLSKKFCFPSMGRSEENYSFEPYRLSTKETLDSKIKKKFETGMTSLEHRKLNSSPNSFVTEGNYNYNYNSSNLMFMKTGIRNPVKFILKKPEIVYHYSKNGFGMKKLFLSTNPREFTLHIKK